ncbi:3-carboxy-cis,cis-muconate cycloisomerase [compost metagenome]
MRTEIDEIEEPFSIGKIGSTTMPHKRNPAAFEGLASLTNPVLKSAALMHDSLKVEHERDAMSWRVEWIALPEINIYLSSQLATAQTVLANLTVKEENMQRNLELQHGLLLSEKVMFEVGRVLGKQTAHHLVYECAMKAFEEKRSFQSVLLEKKEIAESFSVDEVASWLVPSQYLGSAVLKVDEVIAHAEATGLLTSELGLVEAQLQ